MDYSTIQPFCLAILLTFASLGWPSMARAQQPTDLTGDQIAAIEDAVELQIEQQQLVGLAAGVVHHGQVVYTRYWGFEDREMEVPVTDQTLFRWASVSKPVTSVAAMILMDEGKLDLDADVRHYVPEFPDHGVKITSRQILCHQSGIVHYANGPVVKTQREYDVENPFESVILALDRFKESPLVYQPGESYAYSTHGFILMSAVVERASGTPFAQFVKERIFVPLGMETVQPDYQWTDIPHRAIGYRLDPDKNIVPSTNTDVSWKLGGGGLVSNVTDMAKFAAGLSRRELLSEQAYDQMWTAQITARGEQTEAGLGFFVDRRNGETLISHSGSQEKTRTHMLFFPNLGFGLAVMTNSEYGQPGRISTAILNSLKIPPSAQ